MLNGGVEQAYVVFDATNTDKITWFSEETILYSSYGIDLDDAPLDICSIEGYCVSRVFELMMLSF